MKKTRRAKKLIPAETIAHMADNGKDVSRFFTNSGKMIKPIQRQVRVSRKYIRIMRSPPINQ
jgi:hypothetical protein